MQPFILTRTRNIPVVFDASIDPGLRFSEFSAFIRAGYAGITSAGFETNASGSQMYTTGTYTACDYVTGGCSEAYVSLNAMYDLFISGDQTKGYSIYGMAGGGASFFIDPDFGYYAVGSWPSTYTGGGSPSPDYDTMFRHHLVIGYTLQI